MRRQLPLFITIAVFLAGYAICLAQFPSFASTRVIANLLTDNAFLGIVAVGMTFVIISGGIDLSVGSVIAFTGVFIAITTEQYGVSPYVAFAMILVIAAAFGAGMGYIIHTFQIPAFIVTLAGMFLARGMSFVLTTDSIPISAPLYGDITDMAFLLPGGGRLTFIAIVMLLVVAVGMVLAHFTKFGANVYALGGNRTSAELMGVPVGRTTIQIYTLSSVLAALSGIVFSFYTSAGYSLAATGVELDTIAAVVIGGTLLTGGYGTIFGTFVGVLIQGLIQTYITFEGTLSSWWTKIAIGALLFAFIALQRGLTVLSSRNNPVLRI
ncbi:galactofuranose ABC transporter, permease protein YjfF [Microvirga pudoricolor]|uniref:galactofuranose ABC transporter, permease protein YjfF n=1 Tax=Microvirga pudoricolor TaxID=2778729 RepID=UPI001E36E950|nr:galactofuranose ABC transporter, permease protein YjfF [Microvirga pudoricolor]